MSHLSEVPSCISHILPILSKHQLSLVFCSGVDYEKESSNIYFLWPEVRKRTVEDVRSILTDLHLHVPEDEKIVSCCADAGSLGLTMRWDSNQVERACFYIPVTKGNYEFIEDSEKLLEFAKGHQLPSSEAKPNSWVGCSIGHKETDFYNKLETDYYGNYFQFLSQVAMFHYLDNQL